MIKEESRQGASLYFEGMTSIRAVIAASKSGVSDRRIVKVYVDRERLKSKEKEISYLKSESLDIVLCDASEIESIAVGNSHGGIIAECTDRTIKELSESDITSQGFYVMIEGIEDPYNFGYAIRSIYASGADGIVLSPRNWMSAAGVVCRSSAGASELIPVYISAPSDAVNTFKSLGYKTACAGIRDSVSAYDADLTRPLFLVVGGEKRGISRAVLDKCDTIVRLDYGREFRGSLSAASAASILAYEVFRQNKNRLP